MNRHVVAFATGTLWPLAGLAFHIGCSGDDGASTRGDAGPEVRYTIPPPPPATEAAAPPEAGPDTKSPTCDITKPFGDPVLVRGLGNGIDIARLSADELTIYFNSYGADLTRRDLYFAKRQDRFGAFGDATPLSKLNSPTDNDTAPTVTPADTMIFYTSNRATEHGWHIFWSQRSDPSLPFPEPSQVQGFDVGGNLTDPAVFVGPEGIELWFRSDGTGQGDIYKSTFANGKASIGIAQSAFNVADSNDLLPVMNADRRVVYFGSNRPGRGGFDIWAAHRPTPVDAFTSVTSVEELNGPDSEWPTWMSPDGCRLYLVSTRGGGHAMYVAERPR